MAGTLIESLIKSGAPWGLLCAVLLFALVTVWRRSVTLADKLYELAVAQVEKDAEVHGALTAVREDLAEIRRTWQ